MSCGRSSRRTGQKEYIVSFIGFAPADDPKIAILVFLDTPSDKSGIYISGGQMAAPVVGRMLADILPYLGVEPAPEDGGTKMPGCLGLDLPEAAERLEEAGLRFRTRGGGSTVTDQLPAAGTEIAPGTEIILYFDADISPELETVPELTGMSLNEARDTLSYYGLYLNALSSISDPEKQSVSAQSIPAGTALCHGSVVEVTLIDSDEALLGRY